MTTQLTPGEIGELAGREDQRRDEQAAYRIKQLESEPIVRAGYLLLDENGGAVGLIYDKALAQKMAAVDDLLEAARFAVASWDADCLSPENIDELRAALGLCES